VSGTAKKAPPRHGALRGYPKDTDGWPLCRYCLGRCPTKRHTFCSDPCITEWKIRSDPACARWAVQCRDQGVCSACGFNTHEIAIRIRAYTGALHVAASAHGRARREDPTVGPLELWPAWAAAHTGLLGEIAELKGLGWDISPPDRWHQYGPTRMNLWQADHIHPVEHGGGMVGLEGLQTLCTLCHKAKTRAQAQQRRKVKPSAPFLLSQ
jgi:5-methylcytosine-specific restriction protein A